MTFALCYKQKLAKWPLFGDTVNSSQCFNVDFDGHCRCCAVICIRVVGLPHTFRLIPVYPSCAEKNIIDLFHFLLDCTMQRCIQFMLQFIIPHRMKNAVWTLVFLEVEVDNHGGPNCTYTCHIEVAVHTSMYWRTEVAVSTSVLSWGGREDAVFTSILLEGRSSYCLVYWEENLGCA